MLYINTFSFDEVPEILAQGMLIIDSELYNNSTELLSRDARSLISIVVKQQLKTAYQADTLEQLAELTGIDSGNLLATVELYNACARGEQQTPLTSHLAICPLLLSHRFMLLT